MNELINKCKKACNCDSVNRWGRKNDSIVEQRKRILWSFVHCFYFGLLWLVGFQLLNKKIQMLEDVKI